VRKSPIEGENKEENSNLRFLSLEGKNKQDYPRKKVRAKAHWAENTIFQEYR
jgi:hypothetical protein